MAKKKAPKKSSKRSVKKPGPCWVDSLTLTTDQREWLLAATDNGAISLEQLPDTLDAAGLQRLLSVTANEPPLTAYERHKVRAAQRAKQQSLDSRDIGPLPPVRDPERRAACERNLLLFLQTYLGTFFPLPFCEDHYRIIAKIQTAVLHGLMQSLAMPRGSGKSSYCRGGVIWSGAYGHHLFSMLLHANAEQSAKALKFIRTVLETNPLLADDFPEVCYPILALQRVANRAKGQLYQGQPTYIEWGGDTLILPVIPGARSSGATIVVAGLQEAVRGAVYFHPVLQRPIRPTLILIDDPSTRTSAQSPDENDTRESIIASDLPGCVGPGEKLSMLMPCTVIKPNDVASRFLDRQRRPEWRGERCKMLYEFPSRMDLWQQNYDIVLKCLSDHVDGDQDDSLGIILAPAIEHYRANLEAMRAGAKVAWDARHEDWQVDGLQYAMYLFFKNPEFFASECQNDPLAALDLDDEQLHPDTLCQRLNNLPPRVVPTGCQYVTAHIDCHKRVLFYAVAAWSPGFDGSIIDYGAFPKQAQGHFTERTARPTLQDAYPDAGLDGAIRAGVLDLATYLFGRTYERVDGARLSLDMCLVDSGYRRDAVFAAAQDFATRGKMFPSFGRNTGPNDRLLSTCKPRQGEFIGQEWTVPAAHGRSVREVQFDASWWKSFVARRLLAPITAPGALTLFGELQHGRPAVNHGFFAQHLSSEYSMPQTGRFTREVWNKKPGSPQNHWWDTVVGCAVAASVAGAKFMEPLALPAPAKKRRITKY